MKNLLLWAGLALGAGCAEDVDDVVGPFTGEVHRFVVDEIRLPTDSAEVRAFGADLNGDQVVDNQLGAVTAALSSQGILSRAGADMIRAGAIASVVEIQADDLGDDAAAGVRYLGADGAPATVVGGRFAGGAFTPNRTARTQVPGEARVRLPVLPDADPMELRMQGLEIELRPDPRGGFTATLRGAIDPAELFASLHQSFVQHLASDPTSHITLWRLLDRGADGEVTREDVSGSQLLSALLDPDLRLPRSEQLLLSFGFEVHLSPCAEGRCAPAAPAPTCGDRVRNGFETDVDCGGGCPLACAGDLACGAHADCQSGLCDAGVCARPSCTDGLHDGIETDVDCGGVCGPCASGQRCERGADCASGSCSDASPATCRPQ